MHGSDTLCPFTPKKRKESDMDMDKLQSRKVMREMRKYIRWAIPVMLALVFDLWLTAGANAINVRNPYVQDATPGSVDVMWGNSSAAGILYWGTSPGSYTNTVASTSFADTAGDYVHTARIDGLAPSQTVYYYVDSGSEVIGRNDASYHATAAPSGNAAFRFAAYGDSRIAKKLVNGVYVPDYDVWCHADVVNRMAGRNPRLVLHVGDMVDLGNVWEYNDYYFAPAAPLVKNTPFYTAIGNHELYSDPHARNYRDMYGLPTNSADGTEDYYSFDYGCVHFTALDSEMLSCGTAGHIDAARAADMKEWLEADLAATDKPWKAVFFHRPTTFSCVSAAWKSLFEQYGVDIVFQGHTHLFQHYVRNGVNYVITGGGGAELDRNAPGGGSGSYFKDWHFCMIDASIYGLDVKVYGIDSDDDLRHSFYIEGEPIPEPGCAIMLLSGLVLLLFVWRRRSRYPRKDTG